MDGHANCDKFGYGIGDNGTYKEIILQEERYVKALRILLNHFIPKEKLIDKIKDEELFEMKVDLILATEQVKNLNIDDIISKIKPN